MQKDRTPQGNRSTEVAAPASNPAPNLAPTPGQPVIVIWLGPDGRPRCEAPSSIGARRLMPELVTQEQAEILYDFAERQRIKLADEAISRNQTVWSTCARRQGTDFANERIGRAKRTKDGGVTTIHPKRSRNQQARDVWDHEMGLLMGEEIRDRKGNITGRDYHRRETLRQIPLEMQLTPFEMSEIVKRTLGKYGFTPEEIRAAQLTKPTPKGAAATKSRKNIPELLSDL